MKHKKTLLSLISTVIILIHSLFEGGGILLGSPGAEESDKLLKWGESMLKCLFFFKKRRWRVEEGVE